MGTTPEEHAGRSAELQRLLDEADGIPTPVGQRRPLARPPVGQRRTGASRNPEQSAGSPGRGSNPPPSTTSSRSPLRSSPPVAFPRRAKPTTPRPADATSSASSTRGVDTSRGDASRRVQPEGDSARLRRSALVRSPIGAASARRLRTDRDAEPGGVGADPRGAAGRPRGDSGAKSTVVGRQRGGAAASGAAARGAGRSVPPATKTALTRSLAGRWGAAGIPVAPDQRDPDHRSQPGTRPLPEQHARPEHRAAVEVPFLPRNAVRRTPVAEQPVGGPQAAPIGRSSGALPPIGRPRQRRTLVLAGGVAAAVVAIVAIVSLGGRNGSSPAANADSPPTRVAMVQSTGADGRSTVATVTAPVSTVNGRVVALVPDADGRVQQLTVVTATPPAPTTTHPSPTRTSAPSSSDQSTNGGAAPTSASPSPTPTPTPTPTSASAATHPSTRSTGTPGGDVATVVTGLTKLTGWVPRPTG